MNCQSLPVLLLSHVHIFRKKRKLFVYLVVFSWSDDRSFVWKFGGRKSVKLFAFYSRKTWKCLHEKLRRWNQHHAFFLFFFRNTEYRRATQFQWWGKKITRNWLLRIPRLIKVISARYRVREKQRTETVRDAPVVDSSILDWRLCLHFVGRYLALLCLFFYSLLLWTNLLVSQPRDTAL